MAKIEDQEIRNKILATSGSIAIQASAGSGKTTIVTKKIETESRILRPFKKIAAITFTNKARDEIRDKLEKIDEFDNVIVTTNDAFIKYEIINPFIRNVYPEVTDFQISYSQNDKFKTFKDGIEKITEGILGSYENQKCNFTFQLALNILKKSPASQQYLKSTYEMIFIDEYQDSDQDMRNLFRYLFNELDIRLFVVGDDKQSIYGWRGSVQFKLDELPESIKKFKLTHNFRCDDEINDFANIVRYDEKISPSAESSSGKVEIVKSSITTPIQLLLTLFDTNRIDMDSTIAILVKTNSCAKKLRDALSKHDIDFETVIKAPIDDDNFSNKVKCLEGIVKYSFDQNYTVYDFFNELLREPVKEKQVDRLLSQIACKDSLNFSETVDKLGQLLGLEILDEEKRAIWESLNDQYKTRFMPNNNNHVILTVHKSKGLEFDQVIFFDNIINIRKFNDDDERNKHYVAVTRAKHKVIILANSNDEYINRVENAIKEKGYQLKRFVRTESI